MSCVTRHLLFTNPSAEDAFISFPGTPDADKDLSDLPIKVNFVRMYFQPAGRKEEWREAGTLWPAHNI